MGEIGSCYNCRSGLVCWLRFDLVDALDDKEGRYSNILPPSTGLYGLLSPVFEGLASICQVYQLDENDA